MSKRMCLRNTGTGIRKNIRIKSPRLRVTGRQVIVVVFLLLLLMGSGIGYVWSNFERTQIGYDLSQLKKEEFRLREIHKKLTLELAFLKSPANLEAQAVRNLGLQQPRPEQIIVLP
jgi:cell division protein FtsL